MSEYAPSTAKKPNLHRALETVYTLSEKGQRVL